MAKENSKRGIMVNGGRLINQNGETSTITKSFSAKGLSGVISALSNINPSNVGAVIECSVNGQRIDALPLELVAGKYVEAYANSNGAIKENYFIGCKKGLVRSATTGHHIPGVAPNDVLHNFEKSRTVINDFVSKDRKIVK